MLKSFFFTFFCLFICVNSFAIDGILLKTIDYSFKDKWENTVGGSAPIFSTPKHLFKGQYLFITVIVGDYNINKKGKANVKYSIKITKPDGSVYFSQENLPILEDKTITGKYFQMSDAILKVSFEDKDMFGKYKIEANITDVNVNKSTLLKSDIELEALPKYERKKTDAKEFNKWFYSYFQNPSPEAALDNYLYFFETDSSEDKELFLSVTTFFVEIFKNNHFLLAQIKETFRKKDDTDKMPLVYLLKMSGMNEKGFLDLFDKEEKEYYAKIKGELVSYMYGDILENVQLDMLWFTFFATGSYKPILKLAQTLDYVKYEGEVEKYNKSKKEEGRENAMKGVVFVALNWSMKSNAEQYKLVKDFLNWALKNDKLSAVQKEELEKILKK